MSDGLGVTKDRERYHAWLQRWTDNTCHQINFSLNRRVSLSDIPMRQLSNTMRNFRLLGTGICLLTGYLVYFHWPRMTNLPVYFSVLFLLNLGLLCWITNLYILNVSGIPTKRLLGLTVDTVPSVGRLSPSGSPGAGIYSDLGGLTSLNLTLTTVSLVSFLVFLAFETVHGEERAEWIPLWTYIGLGAFFLNPWPIGYYKERLELSRALKRIALGGLSDPVPFCDVLFADIMTSFSRVFGDLKWIMADLLLSIDTETALAGRIWIEILVPLLISLPYAFRLRQCLAEAHQTKDSVDQKRHYLNAIKYLSAFPVVLASFWINHLRSIYASEEIKDSVSVSQTLNIAVALWIGFSVLNSAFTLYWDVIRDWQIFFPWMPTFLGDPQGGSSGRSLYSLGRPLFFGSTVPYILATLFNAIVRLFWVGKITLMYSVVDHLLRPKETDEAALPRLLLVDVSLKVLEVLRRWVWVFFRVEREWVVSLPSGTGVRTGEGLSYDMVDIESND